MYILLDLVGDLVLLAAVILAHDKEQRGEKEFTRWMSIVLCPAAVDPVAASVPLYVVDTGQWGLSLYGSRAYIRHSWSFGPNLNLDRPALLRGDNLLEPRKMKNSTHIAIY